MRCTFTVALGAVCLLGFSGCASSDGSPSLTGDYLGQNPPGVTPELFAPGIFCNQYQSHSAPAFSPDGNLVFWSMWLEPFPNEVILFIERIDGVWSEPEVAPFSGEHRDGYPFFSSDGAQLYFNSTRPDEDGEVPSHGRLLWSVEMTDAGWSAPARFSPGDLDTGALSITDAGDVYFTSFGGEGRNDDIFRMSPSSDGYSRPERLPETVNSPHPEFDPVVSSDGSVLLFTGFQRPDGFAFAQLYVSFRQEDGSWSEARNLGQAINRTGARFARLSPDGRYLFFTASLTPYPGFDGGTPTYEEILGTNASTCGGSENVYWVDARILETLMPDQ